MILIRKATEADIPRIFELINALAIFENEAAAVEISVKQLLEDGFGAQPKYICFVAEIDDKVQGIALIYFRYSTWKGEVVHLEDLIVDENFRGQGIGEKLLNAVIEFGKERQVKRISWEVLDWNINAINFYKKKGAKILEGWQVVQMDEQTIKQY